MNKALRKIQRCNAAHKAAAERLIAAVREALPVGTLVEVYLGRSHVVGEVTAVHDCWWYRPGDVTIRNINTDKPRCFNAGRGRCDFRIVHTPALVAVDSSGQNP